MTALGQQATSPIHQALVRSTPQTGHLRARYAGQQRANNGSQSKLAARCVRSKTAITKKMSHPMLC
jgi:hypothetical protein